ncbi:MAG: hypothetical protein ACJAQ3_001726 [Planctomycetota bacterium]|jgi:hypothetical protein
MEPAVETAVELAVGPAGEVVEGGVMGGGKTCGRLSGSLNLRELGAPQFCGIHEPMATGLV